MNLEVKHELQPEHEVKINADCWCDIGSHKVTEYEYQIIGDVGVCDDCYEHYN